MNYVIAIEDNERSVNIAQRCIASAAKYGTDVEIFSAITPRNTDIYKFAEQEGIDTNGFNEVYSRLDNCIAAFLSHYSVWKLAAKSKQPVTIFEHDAVVVDQIDNINFDRVVTLGKPSYGKFNTPTFLGTGPLVQKPYFGGAHAYRVSKEGASELIKQAKIKAKPTDVFLNTDTFPWLQENYPWKVEVNEAFSTIQKTQGCLAKHQYGESYELL